MSALPTIPKKYIQNFTIHQLQGRVVELPPPDTSHTTDILVIYGHHSSLERMYSTAEAINQFGAIIMPDLPGFGGMPSLSTIGQRPSVDALADFLAAFVEQRFQHTKKKIVIFGMSFGFVVATRMLQRHPELQTKVDFLISFVGFTHYKDFKFKARNYNLLKFTSRTLGRPLPSRIVANTLIQRPFIAGAYHLRSRTHPKMKGFSYEERKRLIDFEVILWQSNELYTYFATGHEMLTLDLTDIPVAVPVHHIAVDTDQYFDNRSVKRHMEMIFKTCILHPAVMDNHAPTIIEDATAAKEIIPASIGELFVDSKKML